MMLASPRTCHQPPVPGSSHSDAFAKLLESGDLSMSSIKVEGIRMSFQNLLAKICFHHHFSGKRFDMAAKRCGLPLLPVGQLHPAAWLHLSSVAVVERVDSCASMYSRSIQGHHVCLLVKKVSPSRRRPDPSPAAPPPGRCPHPSTPSPLALALCGLPRCRRSAELRLCPREGLEPACVRSSGLSSSLAWAPGHQRPQ